MTATGKNRVMLVIDDDAAVRESLRAALELKGLEVHLAKSGEEGLIRVTQRHPSVVVIDYSLLGMNGAETTRRLRLVDPDLAVVAISAEKQHKDEMLEAGACAFIEKPINVEDLVHAISIGKQPVRQ